ncbi:hypothetical protein BOTBODRAFT_178095 [Botryobasidium botryosum FD-172 SS1]|uniref:Uncharacterized protein n=1 Tax=Botryobasidium botryosum (strain FD-172 SS1) TaxID=930990 RepID=A0A067M7D2_BOTB1|nr:hypothetical protein BOTBODRAFT_178095 [Botryobasidium botryosum FD-172 SS1]
MGGQEQQLTMRRNIPPLLSQLTAPSPAAPAFTANNPPHRHPDSRSCHTYNTSKNDTTQSSGKTTEL